MDRLENRRMRVQHIVLIVNDEMNVSLLKQVGCLSRVRHGLCEPKLFEQLLQLPRYGRSELYKLDSAQSNGVSWFCHFGFLTEWL